MVPEVAGPDGLKSIPVQKYFPVFVRTMLWMVGSEENDVIMERRCCTIEADSMLPLLGLLRVIVPVDSALETNRVSEDIGIELVVLQETCLVSVRLA